MLQNTKQGGGGMMGIISSANTVRPQATKSVIAN